MSSEISWNLRKRGHTPSPGPNTLGKDKDTRVVDTKRFPAPIPIRLRSGLQLGAVPPQSRQKIPHSQVQATIKLAKMYFDLEEIWKEQQQFFGTVDYDSGKTNPYRTWKTRTWSGKKLERYRALNADESFGREFLVIAMHSNTFAEAMAHDTDVYWDALKGLVGQEENKYSLRMFAIMRRLPYVENYNGSMLPIWLGNLDSHHSLAVKKAKGFYRVHEVYRDVGGDIVRLKYNRNVQRDVAENIYLPTRFRQPRPPEWPPKWDYPMDPTMPSASMERHAFPRCCHCDKIIVPAGVQILASWASRRCICKKKDYMTSPLVEIKEFSAFDADDGLPVNRGVRALCDIPEDVRIGDYVGDLIPLAMAQKQWRDPHYALALDGPPVMDRFRNWEFTGKVCNISSGWNGNWTRYINHRDIGNNVEFCTESLAGKTRVVVRTLRKIMFGEELTINYGEDFFLTDDSSDNETIKRPKKKRKTS